MSHQTLETVDPEIAHAIALERERQENHLELIASENTVSPAILAAQGSILTNKYAEGYPDKRYYGGCQFVDVAEKLAVSRAMQLFGAAYANVQAHSGSQANMAVYFALLSPGDTVLGMDLAHGGHLTHGSPVSFSGRLFNFVHYGVHRETECIDFDQVEHLAEAHRPKLIVAGASAYPRIIDFERFAAIAKGVGARLMIDMAHIAGLVAGGVHPSPVPHADVVTSTTHKTLRGPRGGLILGSSDLGALLNRQIFPGIQGGPLMHVIAAKAVAFKEALAPSFRSYQRQIVANAAHLGNCLRANGVRLVTNGTDNHMLLVDLTPLGITGKEAESTLGKAGITVNKNAIPFDPLGPNVTSGIRIGTPVLTTRGMKASEMELVADWIASLLKHPDDAERIRRIRLSVRDLCGKFPLFDEVPDPAPAHA
ncbi:MAG: serine hydroxymethyltransferase [Desulfobacterales bacterium]